MKYTGDFLSIYLVYDFVFSLNRFPEQLIWKATQHSIKY